MAVDGGIGDHFVPSHHHFPSGETWPCGGGFALTAADYQRAGSRAPAAMIPASTSARIPITNSAAGTPTSAATVPAMSGPRKNPNATELALKPNTVLCASCGVSRPIMLAVAGITTPLNRPLRPIPATTSAGQGAIPIIPTATATRAAAAAAVRT